MTSKCIHIPVQIFPLNSIFIYPNAYSTYPLGCLTGFSNFTYSTNCCSSQNSSIWSLCHLSQRECVECVNIREGNCQEHNDKAGKRMKPSEGDWNVGEPKHIRSRKKWEQSILPKALQEYWLNEGWKAATGFGILGVIDDYGLNRFSLESFSWKIGKGLLSGTNDPQYPTCRHPYNI